MNQSNNSTGSPFIQARTMATLPTLEYWMREGIEPPQYVVSQIAARRTIALFGGPEDNFKTQLGTQVAVCVASGIPWLTFPCNKGRVVYLVMEGDPNYIFGLLADKAVSLGVGEEAPKNINVNMFIRQPLDDKATVRRLDMLLEPLRPIDFLIADPITYLIANDVRYSPTMNKVMDNLEDLAMKYNMAVMPILHTRKSTKSVDNLDAFLGSRVTAARASTRILVIRRGDTDEAEIGFRTRMSETPDKLSLIHRHPLIEAEEAILREGQKAQRRVQEILRENREVRLADLMREVAQSQGVNDKTVRKALSGLETKGLVSIDRIPGKPDKKVIWLGD